MLDANNKQFTRAQQITSSNIQRLTKNDALPKQAQNILLVCKNVSEVMAFLRLHTKREG